MCLSMYASMLQILSCGSKRGAVFSHPDQFLRTVCVTCQRERFELIFSRCVLSWCLSAGSCPHGLTRNYRACRGGFKQINNMIIGNFGER